MKKFIQDFKAFALKGNIVDMAVGVIIGGAFGKIVTSFVSDIISPLIGLLTGHVMLSDLKWVISSAVMDSTGAEVQPEVAVLYGSFIQNIVDFLIIALSIFLAIKVVIKAQERIKKKEEPQEEPEKPQTELDVLNEIRDILSKAD